MWLSAFPPDSDESSDSDCGSVKTARSKEHADASAQRRVGFHGFCPVCGPAECGSRVQLQNGSIAQTPSCLKASSVQKLTELGPYMDVSVQPAGKVSQLTGQQCNGAAVVNVCSVHLSQLNPPGVMSGNQEEGQVLNRQVKGSRVGSLYSSDTSYDSSASSDLEVGLKNGREV